MNDDNESDRGDDDEQLETRSNSRSSSSGHSSRASALLEQHDDAASHDNDTTAKTSDHHQRTRRPKSYLLPWQRKQAQRQIAETWFTTFLKSPQEMRKLRREAAASNVTGDGDRSGPPSTSALALAAKTQVIDTRRMLTRFGPGPDRGRMIHRLDLEGGYALDTALHRRASPDAKLTTSKLPPIDEPQQIPLATHLPSKLRHLGLSPPPAFVINPKLVVASSSAMSFDSFVARARLQKEAEIMGFVARDEEEAGHNGGDSSPEKPLPGFVSDFANAGNKSSSSNKLRSSSSSNLLSKKQSSFALKKQASGAKLVLEPIPSSSSLSRRHPASERPLSRSVQSSESAASASNRRIPPLVGIDSVSALDAKGALLLAKRGEHFDRQRDDFGPHSFFAVAAAGPELQSDDDSNDGAGDFHSHQRGGATSLSAWAAQMHTHSFVASKGATTPTSAQRRAGKAVVGTLGAAMMAASASAPAGAQLKKDARRGSVASDDSTASSSAATANAKMRRARKSIFGLAPGDDEVCGLKPAQFNRFVGHDPAPLLQLQRSQAQFQRQFKAATPAVPPVHGAIDHFLNAACPPPQPTAPKIGIEFPSAVPSLKPQLHALVVAIDLHDFPETAVEYSGCVVASKALATMLEQLGFQVRTLFDSEATSTNVAAAVEELLGEVRRLHDSGNAARLLLYFAGRGVKCNGRHHLLCYDEASTYFTKRNLMAAAAGTMQPPAICPQTIAGRTTKDVTDVSQLPMQRVESSSGMSGSVRSAGESTFRWEQPVVVSELRMLRVSAEAAATVLEAMERSALMRRRASASAGADLDVDAMDTIDDNIEATAAAAATEAATPTSVRRSSSLINDIASDLIEGTFACIVAERVPHGTLLVTASARHCGAVTYFFMKALEGGCVQPTVWNINSYIASRLRMRDMPSLQLNYEEPEAGGLAVRSSDLLFPLDRVLLPTAAQRRAQRDRRMRQACSFTMLCEVDARYDLNPFAFLTVLKARLERLVAWPGDPAEGAAVAQPVQPLHLWSAKSRDVARIYFPLGASVTKDSVTQELRELLMNVTEGAQGGLIDPRRAEAAMASFEASRIEWCVGDNCASIFLSVPINRDAFAQGMRGEHFLAFLVHHRALEKSDLLRGTRVVECVAISGSGCQAHVGRLFKHIRLGTVGVRSCFDSNVERLAITALSGPPREETAALCVQKVVRRYLTSRVMRSRLAAACTFVRQFTAAGEALFSAFMQPMDQWYYDFQEESFIALEHATDSTRERTAAAEAAARMALVIGICEAWATVVESGERSRLEVEELVERQLAEFTTILEGTWSHFNYRTQCIVDVFSLERRERADRQRLVAEEFGSRATMRGTVKLEQAKAEQRAAARLNAQALAAATAAAPSPFSAVSTPSATSNAAASVSGAASRPGALDPTSLRRKRSVNFR